MSDASSPFALPEADLNPEMEKLVAQALSSGDPVDLSDLSVETLTEIIETFPKGFGKKLAKKYEDDLVENKKELEGLEEAIESNDKFIDSQFEASFASLHPVSHGPITSQCNFQH